MCHLPCAESVENRLLGQKPQVQKITGTPLHINTQTASSVCKTLTLMCSERQRWCIRRHVESDSAAVSAHPDRRCSAGCGGVSQGTVQLPFMKPRAEASAHCSFSILHDTQEPPASYQGAAAHRVMLLQNKRFLNPLTDYLLRLCEGLIVLHDLRKCLFIFSSFSWSSCATAQVSGYFLMQ